MEPGFRETADVQPYTTRRARLLDDLTLSCRLAVKKEQRFPRVISHKEPISLYDTWIPTGERNHFVASA
jgi:hypothetical protein